MSQKTVLITGCSDGGLGAALAFELQKLGYRVFASARDISKIKELPDSIERVTLEVTSEESIQDCFKEIQSRTGGTLNMLIQNAGVRQAMPITDTDITSAKKTFDVNFWAPMQITQVFMPMLMAARKKHEPATIVFTSSLAALGPTPFGAIYGATKTAGNMFFNTLRLELAPWDINVTILHTGVVSSNLPQNMNESGAQKPVLPPDSLYKPGEEKVTAFMRAEGEVVANAMKREEWAQMVAARLIQTQPPQEIWGGKYSTIGWLGQFLPTSLMRSSLERITGLDSVIQAVKKQRKAE